jgi:hypothetical protein
MAALVGIAPNFRTILASHVAFQLMDRRRLRPPDVIQRDGLMRVAAEAFDLKIKVTGIERIAERRGWLRRTLKAEHALVPRLDGESVGYLARLSGPLRRRPDRSAIDGLS